MKLSPLRRRLRALLFWLRDNDVYVVLVIYLAFVYLARFVR